MPAPPKSDTDPTKVGDGSLIVRFSKDQGQNYGFDGIENGLGVWGRDNFQLGQTQYYVPVKSIEAGKDDYVSFSQQGSGAVTFSLEVNGTATPLTPEGNRIKLNVPVTGNAALYVKDAQKQIVGKLTILSYPMVTKKVVLVSLNGSSLPDTSTLQTELNKIFAQGVASVNISAANLQTDAYDGSINAERDHYKYSSDMRAIVDEFKEKNTIDNNAVYLFFGTTSTADLAGVMNRGGQFGFIFESSTKTIAHELAHGLFALEHTINDNSNGLAANDLMESTPTGTLLYKYQWQYVQNPPAVWSVFESGDDAEATSLFVCNGTRRGAITFVDGAAVTKQHPVWTINGKQYQAFWLGSDFWKFIEKDKLPSSAADLKKFAVMNALPSLAASLIKNITYTTVTTCSETTGSVESDGNLISESGSSFTLTEESNGNIKVTGNWKTFGKCPTCPQIAETLLQTALQKARERNAGKLTRDINVIDQKTVSYGSLPGGVVYSNMKLGDILKNMAQTYNSILEMAKVPTDAWEPGKSFFVRDETAVISGAMDQAIEEARDIPDIAGLGLTLASDPEGAYNQLKTFGQQLSWDKAGDMAAEFAKSLVFANEFEKGGKYALHGTGRAGVAIAKAATTGGMLAMLKNAPEQLKKKLDDIANLLASIKSKLRDPNLADALQKDLSNDAFFNALKTDGELVKAWESLKAYPKLRLDPALLQKAKSILAKGHISADDLQTMLSVNSGLGARATDLANFLDDLDHLALYKGQSGFNTIVSGLKADWYNGAGADGANWVIAALRKEGAEVFPPAATSFEQTITSISRRYDAIVEGAMIIEGQPVKRYFEFKSYGSVPPANFAEQFLKDLSNPDIINLGQLRWLFDAAKNPANFEASMKAAIESMDMEGIPVEILQKFGVPNRPTLKAKLINEFNTIFYLK